MIRQITFLGTPFVLIEDEDGRGGAIATPEAYRTGEVSFAHLFPDGRVMRFRQQIGTRADVVFGEPVDIEPNEGALLNTLVHPSWDGPALP